LVSAASPPDGSSPDVAASVDSPLDEEELDELPHPATIAATAAIRRHNANKRRFI
jgi:hypothetical protein